MIKQPLRLLLDHKRELAKEIGATPIEKSSGVAWGRIEKFRGTALDGRPRSLRSLHSPAPQF